MTESGRGRERERPAQHCFCLYLTTATTSFYLHRCGDPFGQYRHRLLTAPVLQLSDQTGGGVNAHGANARGIKDQQRHAHVPERFMASRTGAGELGVENCANDEPANGKQHRDADGNSSRRAVLVSVLVVWVKANEHGRNERPRHNHCRGSGYPVRERQRDAPLCAVITTTTTTTTKGVSSHWVSGIPS